MDQKTYKITKKLILKYLNSNYFIVIKNNSPFKFSVKVKNFDETKSFRKLLTELSNIFDADDDTLKKILKRWSKNRISNKYWGEYWFDFKLPSGELHYLDYVYQQPQTVEWDHNIEFNPRIGISSRYANREVNPEYYCGIDVARGIEESDIITFKVRPVAPVQHIKLDFKITNEQYEKSITITDRKDNN